MSDADARAELPTGADVGIDVGTDMGAEARVDMGAEARARPVPRAPDPLIAIRPSADDDVPAMAAIFEHHIRRGVGGLGDYPEELFLPADLKRKRGGAHRRRLPHLVAERGGQLAAYAYAVPFRKRPAYRYTLKHSIYVHPDHLGVGVGRRLLPALVEACAAGGYRQMIGYVDARNAASLRLHAACGFAQVGRLPAVAFKYGGWADMVMLQRPLGPGSGEAPATWR